MYRNAILQNYKKKVIELELTYVLQINNIWQEY